MTELIEHQLNVMKLSNEELNVLAERMEKDAEAKRTYNAEAAALGGTMNPDNDITDRMLALCMMLETQGYAALVAETAPALATLQAEADALLADPYIIQQWGVPFPVQIQLKDWNLAMSHTDINGIWITPLQLTSRTLRHEVAHWLTDNHEGRLRAGHDSFFRKALLDVITRTDGPEAAERLRREYRRRKLTIEPHTED